MTFSTSLPLIMMNSMNRILSVFPVSPYGTLAAIGLILWIIFSLNCTKIMKRRVENRVSYSGTLSLFAFSVPIGLICARILWCISDYQTYLSNPKTIFCIWEGGLSLWGFLLGFWLSVHLLSKRFGISGAYSLDVFSPGMLLFVAILRISEVFTGQGIGRIITYDFLVNPFTAVYDSYNEAHFAVYRFEALYAFFLFAVVLIRFNRLPRSMKRSRGDLWRFAVGGYAMAQIVFESMRDDDYMRFGFVRVSQAISILILLIFAFYYIHRLRKAHRLKAHAVWMVPLTLAAAALVIVEEFRVDAALYTEKEHFFMLLFAILLFLPSMFSIRKLARHKNQNINRT